MAKAKRPPRRLLKTALEQLDLLEETYPDAKQELNFESPLQLLIATILAAQNTDQNINRVAPDLFRKYPTARHWAEAPTAQLEEDLRPTGFFRQKTKSVQGACRALLEKHGGEVPDDLPALVALPGVGRKTANVVLGCAFAQPHRVAVDTHVKRLAQRLGLSQATKPDEIERDLEAVWPAGRRTRACHLLQFHGRRCCKARKPDCEACPLTPLCPAAGSFG